MCDKKSFMEYCAPLAPDSGNAAATSVFLKEKVASMHIQY